MCKKLIGRDGVYREELIEGLSIARSVKETLDVMGNGGEIDLTVGDYGLNIDRIELRGVARIIGGGRGRSNIVLMGDKLEITGTGGSKVSMSNLTIRSNGDCDSRIIINGVEAEFENINFVRVGLKVKNSGKISVTSSTFENIGVAIETTDISSVFQERNNYENVDKEVRIMTFKEKIDEEPYSKSAIILQDDEVLDDEIVLRRNIIGNKHKIKIIGSGKLIIGADNLKIKEVEIESDGGRYIIEADGKKGLEIIGCNIKGGIELRNSIGRISLSEIYNTRLDAEKSGAIRLINSTVSIDKVKVYNNYYDGITIENNSKVEIKDADVFHNGNENENYPQIWVESSKANIDNNKIHDGINNTGILVKQGTCKLNKLQIYGNYCNGISIKNNSEVEINGAVVFGNGNKEGDYPQIKASIDDSRIHDGTNNTGILVKQGTCKLNKVQIYGNYRNGIVITNNSAVDINESDVFKNGNEKGNYPQIWVGSSKVNINNSKIRDAVHGDGIYIKDNKCVCTLVATEITKMHQGSI